VVLISLVLEIKVHWPAKIAQHRCNLKVQNEINTTAYLIFSHPQTFAQNPEDSQTCKPF
jgi:hypothetical protein